MWLLWMYQPYMQLCGLPVWSFGLVFALYNGWAALAARLSSKLVSKYGREKVLILMALLQIVPLFLMGIFVSPLSFLFVLGHQSVRGSLGPVINGWILQYTFKDKRATVLSMTGLCVRLFFALTSPVIGHLGGFYDLPTMILLQGVILVVLYFVMFVGFKRIPEKYFKVKEKLVNEDLI
jgi:MFS family permease